MLAVRHTEFHKKGNEYTCQVVVYADLLCSTFGDCCLLLSKKINWENEMSNMRKYYLSDINTHERIRNVRTTTSF